MTRIAVLLSLLGGLSACGTAARTGVPAPAAAADADDRIAARVGADSARRPYTEADIRFMTHMIHHHAQAVLMAGWAPSHEAGPAVRRLAERIASGQEDEIATMRQWLADRGHSAHAESHGMRMPGMLTEDQLGELDAARGDAFDRLFLTFMIQHHRGAVSMVRDLFATRGAARDETVFKVANDVSADQSNEIARMEAMLATLSTETHPQ
ncbi:MAG TPA: DUF305 domain-containing protein [Gemmatimonadales bacterium]|nr:DUF305 domain-containing protein [Gemmatimonadales bacterium]